MRRRSSRLAGAAATAATRSATAKIPVCATTKKRAPSPGKRAKALPLAASRAMELALYSKGRTCVAGVDEAGRGPLAGPVVAAACVVSRAFRGFPDDAIRVRDSKEMSECEREAAFAAITAHPDIEAAFHICNHDRVDEINVLAATMEAMRSSVEKLKGAPDYVLVDGNRTPSPLAAAVETVVKGDSKVFAIACASVIAKVTRDRMMVEYDAQWPAYGFAQHKGYGTKSHMAAIFKHGASPIHRLTFAPLKTMSLKQLRVSKARVAKRDRVLAAKLAAKKGGKTTKEVAAVVAKKPVAAAAKRGATRRAKRSAKRKR